MSYAIQLVNREGRVYWYCGRHGLWTKDLAKAHKYGSKEVEREARNLRSPRYSSTAKKGIIRNVSHQEGIIRAYCLDWE